MTYPRPSAWLLICVLVTGLMASAGTTVSFAASPPPQCTGWTDEFHPPTEIRVRRSKGPNAGHVDVVPFSSYVGTVLRAEYSSGSAKGVLWMQMGALSVKQYAWYYTMHWRGGKVVTTNEDGSTTTECFDVKDTTSDQIYKPEKLVDGVYVPANIPTPANLAGMADTWAISLRKWKATKQTSWLFLTGYRSGQQKPCGSDATGFKIFQKSLRDCATKGLMFEETLRRYYEPNAFIVDPRTHDILDDNGVNGQPTYYGDLGVLTPGGSNTTAWHVYAGNDSGFVNPVTGSFGFKAGDIVGQPGIGDVNGDGRKDVITLLKIAGNGKIRVGLSTGTGYADQAPQDVPPAAFDSTTQLVVGDFDGDLIADVGLLRSTPVTPLPDEPATLVVMKGNANGTFSAPVDWWRGPLDLTTLQVAVGDVNGDGKADLVARDGSAGVSFWVAPSFASCVDPGGYTFTNWGNCLQVPGVGLDVATQWFTNANWTAANTKWVLTDFNRDGRADVVAVVKNGSGIDVFGAKAGVNSLTFGDATKMWSKDPLSLDNVSPIGMDVNPDGLGDVVLVQKSGANTAFQWLRASQTIGSPAVTFVATTPYVDASIPWAPNTTDAY